MPCYLFTYHGHGTWMPDNPKGYVHRTRGLQPADAGMAERYRSQQREPAVYFDDDMQHVMVDTACDAGGHIDVVVHAVATEPTHAHVLVSWSHDRPWKSVRAAIRSALSRRLNETCSKRTWFSDSPSRKRVRDHGHFDYLMLEYLPKHSGVKWFRQVDVDAARRRTGDA